MRAVGVSPNEIAIAWYTVARSKRNGAITGYDVLYLPTESREAADSIDPESLEKGFTTGGSGDATLVETETLKRYLLLADLKESTGYAIFVRAHTRYGPGPFSEAVLAETLPGVEQVSQQEQANNASDNLPLNVSRDGRNESNVLLNVSQTEGNRSNTLLNVSQTDGNQTNNVLVNASQEDKNESNVFPTVLQQRKKRDTTTSAASNPSPLNLVCISTASGLVLSWDGSTDGERIAFYEVTYRPKLANKGGIGRTSLTSAVRTTEPSLLLEDLEESVMYDIVVRAIHAGGVVGSSDVITAVGERRALDETLR